MDVNLKVECDTCHFFNISRANVCANCGLPMTDDSVAKAARRLKTQRAVDAVIGTGISRQEQDFTEGLLAPLSTDVAAAATETDLLYFKPTNQFPSQRPFSPVWNNKKVECIVNGLLFKLFVGVIVIIPVVVLFWGKHVMSLGTPTSMCLPCSIRYNFCSVFLHFLHGICRGTGDL
jgi:hypothetical protein